MHSTVKNGQDTASTELEIRASPWRLTPGVTRAPWPSSSSSGVQLKSDARTKSMDGLYTRHQDKQNALSNSTQSYRNSCPGSEILKTRTDHQSNVSSTRQEREREQLGREQLRHEQLGRSRTMTPRPREGISRWDIVSGPRRNALDAGQHMRGKGEKDPLALWTGPSAQLRSAETSREVPTNHEAPGQSEALGRGLTGVSLLQELWRDCSPEAEARAARQANVRRRRRTEPRCTMADSRWHSHESGPRAE